jgi:predicted RNase H-like HicB family nuclease
MIFFEYRNNLINKLDWIALNHINTWVEAWNKCYRYDWMLELIETGIITVDDNKLRRFACRCVIETPIGDDRTTYNLLQDDRLINAVETAYHYSNGGETMDELMKANEEAWQAYYEVAKDGQRAPAIVMAALATTSRDPILAAKIAAVNTMREARLEYDEKLIMAFHANLLREILGNPFAAEVPS